MALGVSNVTTEEDTKSNHNGDLSALGNYRSGGAKVECASMGDV